MVTSKKNKKKVIKTIKVLTNKEKSHVISDSSTKEFAFNEALKEVESGVRQDGLWAIALSESEMNTQRAKALYLKLRADKILSELLKIPTQHKSEVLRDGSLLTVEVDSKPYKELALDFLNEVDSKKIITSPANIMCLSSDINHTVLDSLPVSKEELLRMEQEFFFNITNPVTSNVILRFYNATEYVINKIVVSYFRKSQFDSYILITLKEPLLCKSTDDYRQRKGFGVYQGKLHFNWILRHGFGMSGEWRIYKVC